jgi:hypothetical protein
VRLGLEWMRQRGQVEVAWEGGQVVLGAPVQAASDERAAEQAHVIQGQLQALLAETAAYRAYWGEADAGRLVNPHRN